MEKNTRQYRSERDDMEGISQKVPVAKNGGHFKNQAVIGRRRKQARIYPRRNGGSRGQRGTGVNVAQENSILDRIATLGLGAGRATHGPAREANNNAEAPESERQRILRRMNLAQRLERNQRRAEVLARRRYGDDEAPGASTDNKEIYHPADDVIGDIIRKLHDFHISEASERVREERQMINVFRAQNGMAFENDDLKPAHGDVLKEDSVDTDLDEIIVTGEIPSG